MVKDLQSETGPYRLQLLPTLSKEDIITYDRFDQNISVSSEAPEDRYSDFMDDQHIDIHYDYTEDHQINNSFSSIEIKIEEEEPQQQQQQPIYVFQEIIHPQIQEDPEEPEEQQPQPQQINQNLVNLLIPMFNLHYFNVHHIPEA
jgi:hypothetical protein